ncbi:MAG TPA: TIM barrel protein [Bryobacteraceae bacterium]|nr:TIM barrel protein [Bryobacteraceae bacterium]
MLKQSVARWCYSKTSMEDLAREGARMGLKGIDLIGPEDWPVAQKYGLVPAMVQPAGVTIPDGWNRKENHDRLEAIYREAIPKLAAAKAPNVIALSGNRKGMSDEEGMMNTVSGLRRITRLAEDENITICLELLNSKVNHKDYMCDRTAWGVEVCRRVDSPRMKLLYDIYHMQIMEGDVIRTIRENIGYIAHFHTGGVPGRHELDDTQELRWRGIATAISALGFTGYFAHEFIPVNDPIRSLEEAVKLCSV